MKIYKIGDSVQATQQITETLPGGRVHIHADPGAVGRVMAVDGEWCTVSWERVGTTTDAHVREFKLLGRASVGRSEIGDLETSA